MHIVHHRQNQRHSTEHKQGWRGRVREWAGKMGNGGGGRVGGWWVGLRARGERGGGRTYLSLIWGPIRSVLIGLSVTFRMEELLLAVKQRGGGRGSCLCLHRFRFWRSLYGNCITVRVLVFLRAAPLLCRLTVCENIIRITSMKVEQFLLGG